VQVTEQAQPQHRVLVDLRPVQLDLTAVGLRPVEGDVRALQQRLHGVRVLGTKRDADAGLDADPDALCHHRLA
jgi:hypothetical protein